MTSEAQLACMSYHSSSSGIALPALPSVLGLALLSFLAAPRYFWESTAIPLTAPLPRPAATAQHRATVQAESLESEGM